MVYMTLFEQENYKYFIISVNEYINIGVVENCFKYWFKKKYRMINKILKDVLLCFVNEDVKLGNIIEELIVIKTNTIKHRRHFCNRF